MAYRPKQVQGGAVGGFTAGSVPFAASDGTLTQDNANFFWDDTNNRLGIGIAAPVVSLHLLGASGIGVRANRVSADATTSAFVTQKARGTVGAEAVPNASDDLGLFQAEGWDSSAYQTGGRLTFRATELWSATAGGTRALLAVKKATTTTLVNSITFEHDNTNNIITLLDATNIVGGSTTGTKIGTAASQLIGFWNTTPVDQPAAEADVGVLTTTTNNCAAIGCDALSALASSVDTHLATLRTKVNNILAKLREPGLIAT